MPEEIKTAQTTVDTEVDSHADVDQNREDVNDVEFAEPDASSVDVGSKPTQTKEQNSENARRRREAERKAELDKATQAARTQAIIETLGGKNPFTNEPMVDSTDVQEYLTMKEIEKNGGDPLADYSKYHKQKQREEAERASKEAGQSEWYRKDLQAFKDKHPEVNVQQLLANPHFEKYVGDRAGEVPLSLMYESFMELTSEYERRAEQKAMQLLANQNASPGALSSTNPTDDGFFTKEQVERMDQQEVHRNYDKIRESMRKWYKK